MSASCWSRWSSPPPDAARWPHELSGGEQQRVALARALASMPRLVLLDEPFSSLDAALRIETREAVAAALQSISATVLLVTHDQAEALSMGQEVAVLREGRMVQVASPTELYHRPADADLARFVGEAILLPGHASAGKVRCALGLLDLAQGMPLGAVDVMVRPEQLDLAPPGRTDLPDALVIGVEASLARAHACVCCCARTLRRWNLLPWCPVTLHRRSAIRSA